MRDFPIVVVVVVVVVCAFTTTSNHAVMTYAEAFAVGRPVSKRRNAPLREAIELSSSSSRESRGRVVLKNDRDGGAGTTTRATTPPPPPQQQQQQHRQDFSSVGLQHRQDDDDKTASLASQSTTDIWEIQSKRDLYDFLHNINKGGINPDVQDIVDDRLCVIKFHASWCKSCQKFSLLYKKLAAKRGDWIRKRGRRSPGGGSSNRNRRDGVLRRGDVRFASVEYGRSSELCHALGVRRLPSVQIYDGVTKRLVTSFNCGPSKFHKVTSAVDRHLLSSTLSSSSDDHVPEVSRRRAGDAAGSSTHVPSRQRWWNSWRNFPERMRRQSP